MSATSRKYTQANYPDRRFNPYGAMPQLSAPDRYARHEHADDRSFHQPPHPPQMYAELHPQDGSLGDVKASPTAVTSNSGTTAVAASTDVKKSIGNGEIIFEDSFFVDNKDAATLTALRKMTAMRKDPTPTTVATYAGYLYALCWSIADIEATLDSHGKPKHVHTFRPLSFALGPTITSPSIVAELGHRLYTLGDFVYFNGLNLLCDQVERTFGNASGQGGIRWGLRNKLAAHAKIDRDASLQNFKLLSAQYAILSDVYTQKGKLGGAYINEQWRKAYVTSTAMTEEERAMVDRMRPEYVAKMAMLCGAMSDMIAMLNEIDLEMRKPITHLKPVIIEYTKARVIAASRASYCVIFAKKSFADIERECERLYIADLSSAAKSIANYMTAQNYFEGGDYKTALYYIRTSNTDLRWFTASNATIYAKMQDLNEPIPSRYSRDDDVFFNEVFLRHFPMPTEEVRSIFYEHVRRIPIEWGRFDLGSSSHEMVRLKTFTSGDDGSAATSTVAVVPSVVSPTAALASTHTAPIQPPAASAVPSQSAPKAPAAMITLTSTKR